MAFGIDLTRLDSHLQFLLGDAQHGLLKELRAARGDFTKVLAVLREQEPRLWESMEEMGPEAEALRKGVEGIIDFLDQTCDVVELKANQTEQTGQVAQHADNLTKDTVPGTFGGGKYR